MRIHQAEFNLAFWDTVVTQFRGPLAACLRGCTEKKTVESVAFSKFTMVNMDTENDQFYQDYTLWWTNIAMENHHAINGKIHYFYGHFQLLC